MVVENTKEVWHKKLSDVQRAEKKEKKKKKNDQLRSLQNYVFETVSHTRISSQNRGDRPTGAISRGKCNGGAAEQLGSTGDRSAQRC
jgi:hypothetical protein